MKSRKVRQNPVFDQRTLSHAIILDDEDDVVSLGPQIASSLPIPIAPLKQGRFGVPMQPKTSLSDRPGVLVPALHKESSAALRRASYAERDRSRLIDPGTLDFTAEEDEDEEEEVDADLGSIGGKGRQSALKILRARNEVPAAGELRLLWLALSCFTHRIQSRDVEKSCIILFCSLYLMRCAIADRELTL